MISFLEGKVIFKGKDFVILNVGGVGYKVFLAKSTLEKISTKKSPLKLFTFCYLQRTTIELYGFLSFKELELFEILEVIPGIGPKTALALASFGSLEKLKKAIKTKDEKLFSQIKGIGKKKIQRLILELTGKFEELEKSRSLTDKDEALEALLALGFSKNVAKMALSQVSKKIKDPEKRVKEALRVLGGEK